MHDLAAQTGVEISEFRKIVHMVQKGEREARQAKKEDVHTHRSRYTSARHQLRKRSPPAQVWAPLEGTAGTSRECS